MGTAGVRAADGVLPEAVYGDGAQGFVDGVDAQAVGVAPLVAQLAVDPVGQDAALPDRHLQEARTQWDASNVPGGVRQDVSAAHRVDRPDAGGHRQGVVDFRVQGDAADGAGAYAATYRRGGIAVCGGAVSRRRVATGGRRFAWGGE